MRTLAVWQTSEMDAARPRVVRSGLRRWAGPVAAMAVLAGCAQLRAEVETSSDPVPSLPKIADIADMASGDPERPAQTPQFADSERTASTVEGTVSPPPTGVAGATAPPTGEIGGDDLDGVAAAIAQSDSAELSMGLAVRDPDGFDEFDQLIELHVDLAGTRTGAGWEFTGHYWPGPAEHLIKIRQTGSETTMCAADRPDDPCGEFTPAEVMSAIICRSRVRFTGNLSKICRQMISDPVQMAVGAYENGDAAASAGVDENGDLLISYDISGLVEDATCEGSGLSAAGGGHGVSIRFFSAA